MSTVIPRIELRTSVGTETKRSDADQRKSRRIALPVAPE